MPADALPLYTVTVRIVVRADGPRLAEAEAHAFLGDAIGSGLIYGAIVQEVEPTSEVDQLWTEARRTS